MQSAVVPWCDKDVNIVVSAPTAVGKTTVAECAFGYHEAHSGKCLYVCPFRAIANEKALAWKETPLCYNGFSVWSGDEGERKESCFVIGTLEAVDFAIKSHSHDEWFSSLECLVLDEAHIIGDKARGSVAESVLMDVSAMNQSCRFILLSATMGNARQISKWVKYLNGKDTKCVSTDWRPVPVEYKVHPVYDFKSKLDETVSIVLANPMVKTLLFVHSKKTGKILVERLRDAGVRTVFHNASVKPSVRKRIEEEFNDPFSGLDILVSTSTLGAGVNIG